MFKLRKNREKELKEKDQKENKKGSGFGSRLRASSESINDLLSKLTPPSRRRSRPSASSSSPCSTPPAIPAAPTTSSPTTSSSTTTAPTPVLPSSLPPGTPPASNSSSPPPRTPFSASMVPRPFSYTGGSGIQLRNSESPLYHPRQVPSTSISVGNSDQSKQIPSVSLGSQIRNATGSSPSASPSLSSVGSGFRFPYSNNGCSTSSPSGSKVVLFSGDKSTPSLSSSPLLAPTFRRDSFSTNSNSTGLTTETTFSDDADDCTFEEVEEEYEEDYGEPIRALEEEDDTEVLIRTSSSRTCSIIEEQNKKKAMMISVAEELEEARFLDCCNRLSKKNIQSIIRLQAYVRRRLAYKKKAKLLKNNNLRDSIAQEILQTERVYVKNLNFIVECFVKPLNPLHAPSVKEGNGTRGRSNSTGTSPALPPSTLLKEKDYRAIFSPTLEIILNYNQELLSQLELKLVKWNRYQTIGDVFIKMTQYLKVYTNYVKGYLEGVLALERVVQTDYQFSNFVREVFRSELNREEGEKVESSLSSLLVAPIQRLPRYVLLLDQMDLATDAEHPDKVLIAKALASMRLVASHVNDQQRELERSEKLLRMQYSVSGIPETILTAHRKFLREGFLTRVKLRASSNTSSISSGSSSIFMSHQGSHGQQHGSISASQSCIKKKLYYCFLLNDTLIFAKPQNSKSRSRRDSVSYPHGLDPNGSLSSRRRSLSRTVAAALSANARQEVTNGQASPTYAQAQNTLNSKPMKFKYVRKYSLTNVEVTNLSDVGFLANHTFELKIHGHGLLLLSAENEEEFKCWMKDFALVSQEMKKKSAQEAAVVAAAVVSSKRKSLRGWLTNSTSAGTSSHQVATGAYPASSASKKNAALLAKTLTDFGMDAEGFETIADQAALRNASSKRLVSRQGRSNNRKRLTDIFPGLESQPAQTADAR